MYYLNARDKKIVEEVVRTVRAGKTSSRPTPTRRTPRGGGKQHTTIKGTSPGVTRATTTFTLGSPESVNGPLPSGTITVTNDPPLDSPSGRTIYARFNVTRGDGSIQTQWDTGDAGNFLEMVRGLADYNGSSEPQVIDHDATGDADPHWHGTGPCEPPA